MEVLGFSSALPKQQELCPPGRRNHGCARVLLADTPPRILRRIVRYAPDRLGRQEELSWRRNASVAALPAGRRCGFFNRRQRNDQKDPSRLRFQILQQYLLPLSASSSH